MTLIVVHMVVHEGARHCSVHLGRKYFRFVEFGQLLGFHLVWVGK